MMKLLESAKSKITKDKNGESVSSLQITEVVLVHCNIANADFQHNSGVQYSKRLEIKEDKININLVIN